LGKKYEKRKPEGAELEARIPSSPKITNKNNKLHKSYEYFFDFIGILNFYLSLCFLIFNISFINGACLFFVFL